MTSRYVGIEEGRKTLGDLVTAAQQGADIILTRNGRPAARLTRYQEDPVTTLLATVSTAGAITDHAVISVDETRDGQIIASPWSRDLTEDEINSGEWNAILAAAGWTVTSTWDDHDGYWTATVREADDTLTVTVADIATELGDPGLAEKLARFAGAFEQHDPRTGRLPKRWQGQGLDARFTRDEADELIAEWHRGAAHAEGVLYLNPDDPDAQELASRYGSA